MRISTLGVILSLSRLDSGIWVLTRGFDYFFRLCGTYGTSVFFCILRTVQNSSHQHPARSGFVASSILRRKAKVLWSLTLGEVGYFLPGRKILAHVWSTEYCKFTEENLKAWFHKFVFLFVSRHNAPANLDWYVKGYYAPGLPQGALQRRLADLSQILTWRLN